MSGWSSARITCFALYGWLLLIFFLCVAPAAVPWLLVQALPIVTGLGVAFVFLLWGFLPELEWKSGNDRPARLFVAGLLFTYAVIALWLTHPYRAREQFLDRVDGFTLVAALALVCIWLVLGASHDAALTTMLIAVLVTFGLPLMIASNAFGRLGGATALLPPHTHFFLDVLMWSGLFAALPLAMARARVTVLRFTPALAVLLVAATPVLTTLFLVYASGSSHR